MKKTLAFLMVLALFVTGVYAFADFDFSSVSDEELMQLPAQIAEEQIKRGLVKSAKIGAGKYIGGQDIPVGSYTAINPDGYTYLTIHAAGKEDDWATLDVLLKENEEVGKFELLDGDILEVSSPVEIKVFSGITWQ